MKQPFSPRRQRGVTLVIGLIFLLVVTLLALSNMREVTLESRITGGFLEQKRLYNAAEAGLREGQRRFWTLKGSFKPPIETKDCTGAKSDRQVPCVYQTDDYTELNKIHVKPSQGPMLMTYKGSDPAVTTGSETGKTVSWMTMRVPDGYNQGRALNPEYGSFLKGENVTLFYENNSKAVNQANALTYLQATHARFYPPRS
ncbi:pilus assembly PilX family protein [Pseudomonas mangiferae]|nr:PilX N-terminal domain-containing pilus assembly protein [Pseudomonas mangiferae]